MSWITPYLRNDTPQSSARLGAMWCIGAAVALVLVASFVAIYGVVTGQHFTGEVVALIGGVASFIGGGAVALLTRRAGAADDVK